MKVLVTSGGTKVPIDKVRSITNMSKGTFGSQIAQCFHKSELVEKVIFLAAKGSQLPPYATNYNYETFKDYEKMLKLILCDKPDIVVLAAAVSDYEVENIVDGKIRSSDEMIIQLKPLPKLINIVKKTCPDSVLCGFKLLVGSTKEELVSAAEKSIQNNGCDLVVANDLSTIKDKKDHSMTIVKEGWNKEFFRSQYYLPSVVQHFCIMEHLSK